MKPPVCIEGFCGSFGWSAGFLAEGFHCLGFDIEHLPHHGPVPPGADLWLQDVLTVHGKQFREAGVLVMSPPCTEFAYMSFPFGLAKKKRREYLDGTRDRKQLTALFDACFRIQREASEAAGRYIPMIVENVRGAQEWVGPAKFHYGSYYLWGDVPALMPSTKELKRPGRNFHAIDHGLSSPSFNGADHETRHVKMPGHDWNRYKQTGETSPHWRLNGADSKAGRQAHGSMRAGRIRETSAAKEEPG